MVSGLKNRLDLETGQRIMIFHFDNYMNLLLSPGFNFSVVKVNSGSLQLFSFLEKVWADSHQYDFL